MMQKLKQHLLALMVVGLVLLTGCNNVKDIKISTSVNPDGSGKRVITMALDKKTTDLIEKENKTELVPLAKKISPPGTRVSKSQKNSHINLTIIMPFKEARDITGRSAKLLGKTEINAVSLTQEDRIFAVRYDLKEKIYLDKDLFGALLPESSTLDADAIEIEYSTRIPGEIRETSGTPVTADKAVWKLKPGGIYKIRTKSILIRWWAVALTGIAVLFIIGFTGALIINFRSRSDQVS
jgi:hypothetical protein